MSRAVHADDDDLAAAGGSRAQERRHRAARLGLAALLDRILEIEARSRRPPGQRLGEQLGPRAGTNSLLRIKVTGIVPTFLATGAGLPAGIVHLSPAPPCGERSRG